MFWFLDLMELKKFIFEQKCVLFWVGLLNLIEQQSECNLLFNCFVNTVTYWRRLIAVIIQLISGSLANSLININMTQKLKRIFECNTHWKMAMALRHQLTFRSEPPIMEVSVTFLNMNRKSITIRHLLNYNSLRKVE